MNQDFPVPIQYRKFDKHLWVDYFEILCLSDPSGEISIGDLEDRISLDYKDNAIEDSDEDVDEVFDVGDQIAAVKDDKLERLSKEHFLYFGYRASTYKDFYPFEVKDKFLKRKTNLTEQQKVYVFLLMCSHFTFFQDEQNRLASDFELLSIEALKKYISPQARIYYFGANSNFPDEFQTYVKYKGNIFDKISALAQDLDLLNVAKKESFPSQATGDKGLDIVAWYPFPDGKKSNFIFLAQCKCSVEWENEKFSSSFQPWHGRIHFDQSTNNVSLIPFCFRRSTGNWHSEDSISGVILFDRQRLLNILSEAHTFFSKTQSFIVVNQFLQNKTTIV